MKNNKLVLIFAIMMTLFIIKPSIGEAVDVVNPKQTYTYDQMVKDIHSLAKQYPDVIQYKIIGYSEYKKPIYAVSLGTGNATVFINGSHHAREWITTNLNMYMLEQYAEMYKNNQSFGGYPVKKVLDETKIWFVPMVNPDGVTLQQSGLKAFPSKDHQAIINMNGGSSDFKRWKANGKGVDLNRQYDADWANIKNNYSAPRWMDHKGYYPEQASEAKAIVKFTAEIDPEMATAYHTSGEILYWKFYQSGKILARDEAYAKRIGQLTGYSLVYPGLNPSGGGYTDWFIIKYKRPGFTPELGKYSGNTNVPVSQFDRIWSENKYVGLYMASEGYKLYLERGGKPKLQEVKVKIDGKPVTFDQSALLINGKTVVPLRGVFAHFGSIVEWDAGTKTILVRKATKVVELKIGSKIMKVNGASIEFDVAPQMINSRTMIPLRAVSEAIGAKVGWDTATTTALISSPPVETDEIAPNAPVVNAVTDVSLTATGTSEVNALVEVKKSNGAKLGEAHANVNGQFVVEIPAQTADTALVVTATDMAGNTSEVTQVLVQYTSTFTDTIGHWSEESIGLLKDRQITNGLSNGSYGINQSITRAEATAMLARALKLDTETASASPFADVPESHYFYKFVAAIYEEGIMRGKPGGLFEPDSTLTRAEMAAILVNAYGLETKEAEDIFSDVAPTHWGYEAITAIASNDLTGGYPDGTFRPDAPITRAEFGTLLARVIQEQEKVTENESNEKEEVELTPDKQETEDEVTSSEPAESQTDEQENSQAEEPSALDASASVDEETNTQDPVEQLNR